VIDDRADREAGPDREHRLNVELTAGELAADMGEPVFWLLWQMARAISF